MSTETLVDSLKLERLELNLFRGVSPPGWTGRIFGGQVIAQSLLAAYQTVEDRPCHSLHAYFIRPGDPSIPIVFEVDRARDGGSFTTRRVIAIQHGEQILNLAASFQRHEEGLEHQAPMPPGPSWDEMAPEIRPEDAGQESPRLATGWLGSDTPRPIEIRTVEGLLSPPGIQEPRRQYWFRAREPIEGAAMNQVVLAYASDMGMLVTTMRPHPVNRRTPGLQSASLDHALWFHRPLNFNRWHLYVQESPVAAAGRGFSRATIFSQDGVLVASSAQEGLLRAPR
jgi:acyl-CoA thioesterase-2